MPSTLPTGPARTRRPWLAVAVVVVLCCVGSMPAVAGPGSSGPVDDPTETPHANGTDVPRDVGEGASATNATRNVTVPTPGRRDDPDVDDGVRTAVDESAERLSTTGTAVRERSSLGARFEPGRERLGPPAGAPGTTPASTPQTDRERTDGSTAARTTPAAAGGAGPDGCRGCGSVVGVGLVLIGLAGSAGAVASFGPWVPRPAARPDPDGAVRWAAVRLPRPPPILPGRFGRQADDDPLSHVTRATLRDVVEERPGVHLGAVVDELEVSRSSVRYHVRVLERSGELETARLLGRRRLFPPGTDSELYASLADDGSRRVVRAVSLVGPAPVGDVVDETGKAYSTVSYHLDRLEAAGVVERERDGRQVTVRLAGEAAEQLVSSEAAPAD